MTLDMSHPLLLDEGPATNGALAAGDVPPLAIRQVARRVRWLPLNDEESYPGFEIKVWLNPSHMAKRIAEWGPDQSNLKLVQLIVLEHNGWADEDGVPYPPATDPDFFAALPQHLGNTIGEVIAAALQNPNLTRTEKRN